jgi:hypothetical protein
MNETMFGFLIQPPAGGEKSAMHFVSWVTPLPI